MPDYTILRASALLLAPSLFGQTAVWTAHYDNFRTGANTSETALSPANVNPATFGKLASLPVSGCVFAQPLFVPNTPRNLVILATTTNRVYAYDSDDYTLQFSRSFGLPAPSIDFCHNGAPVSASIA